MRRTKIVCTIGPACRGPEAIAQLIEAGMNVARLNCSHGTAAERVESIARIRAASRRLNLPVAILLDLAGPKVRIGDIAGGQATLRPGRPFVLTNRPVTGSDREVSLSYGGMPADVHPGDALLLGDSALELTVENVTDTDIACRVVVGGVLASRKGISAPSRSLRVAFPTAKDARDLAFGIEQAVDYVALSFVRTAEDVLKLRAAIGPAAAKDMPPLIAKIEKHEALDNIDAILDQTDGIMVARGDLGVEIPIERIPRVQKWLIAKANQAAKPVITATQMLRSMVDSPRPTRAEATDVANAIMDGTDAVMLSEETAVGSYPFEAVRMMDRLARDAEEIRATRREADERAAPLQTAEAVAQAAARLAEQLEAKAILTCTQSGSTTRLVSKSRPRAPLLALTPDPRTFTRMALVWGAIPLMMDAAADAEAMERQALRKAIEAGLVEGGGTVVITAGLPLHVPGTTNTVKVAVADVAAPAAPVRSGPAAAPLAGGR